jgi:hypothetical protein
MPTATVSKGNLASTDTTTSGTGSGTTTPIVTFNWNFLGNATRTITINTSNYNNAYIIGSPVETYLNTSDNFSNANYCLVTTFSIGGAPAELRTRVLPISYYDFTAKRTVRNLRVDFPDVANSSTYCSGVLKIKNTTGSDFITDATSALLAKIYDPTALCSSCTTSITSTKTRLFKVSGTELRQVPDTNVSVSLLTLKIDPNNLSNGEVTTCTNSSCQSRGYNCCLDNQCVNDGSVKPAAATQYASLLAVAQQEILQNPMAYLNYPQLYYICGSSPGSTTGGTTSGGTTSGSTGGTTSGSTGGYDEAFTQLKKDYYCIENLKSQSSVTPFHTELLSRTYTASTDCLTASSQASNTQYYQTVVKRLYTTCGCNRTDLSDMITNCPAYEYTVVQKDTNNVPTRIDCYTPPSSTPVPTVQTISVSSRSAPHRFFDENGVEKNPSLATVQEGDKFEYLDDGKILPNQKAFSMNAILGQMSVTLDQALPAKAVSVELDQVYFLSTVSGYYTPCPTCGKDSWLNSFTAFPVTGSGVGLQAIGHTTERDAFSTNTTGGNYEDTIFGRACWLPPTMLPYSQPASTYTDIKAQRLDRLQTQSALFVNGYQRDWYGFNKGALIGSFDGVSWFAIGKGRIVKSSSKKLFLAINAPFADLANPSIHVVRVQAYDGVTQATQVDYDPQYHQTHPYQNEAGNCQMYHMCSTDTDCITKLGWEYACADVKDLKTNWPQFDINGNEILNSPINLTLDKILVQKKIPSSSTKRCVYRGSGSLCHSNVGTLAATDLNKRKLLTCAPNFYCADSSTSAHNNKIARYASTLENIPVSRNHMFGKDANVLGRPHDYLGLTNLTGTIRQNLIANTRDFEPTLSSYVGLCQPGKALPTTGNYSVMQDPFNQQMSMDGSRRTDFISQIGSCNSTLFNPYRHTSCPVIGADGNYERFATADLAANFNLRASSQNACGLETLHSNASLTATADSLSVYSPFRNIEAKTLNSQIVLDPTLARDACFRRAGAACHTDLDCSPNKLHATQVDFFGKNYFGNEAEKSYWNEYLICGQTDPKPLPTQTEAFKNYDMSLNRCCREIGKDLTTYTSDLSVDTSGTSYEEVSAGLKMSEQAFTIPHDEKRYSRLSTVEGVGTTKPILTANTDRDSSGALLTTAPNISTTKQWQTLSEANSESCCGGGWIRKFSDGSNDWTVRNRVALDVTNFQCINSRTPLITHPEDVGNQYLSVADVQTLVTQDYGDYCKDGTNTKGSCAQYSIVDSLIDVLPTAAGVAYGTAMINTIKPVFTTGNLDHFFTPRSADGDASVIVNYGDSSTGARRNISIRIPSYVTRDFDVNHATAGIRMTLDDGTGVACVETAGFNAVNMKPSDNNCGGTCCYRYDSFTRILRVGLNPSIGGAAPYAGKKVGLEFKVDHTAGNHPTPALSITRLKPGSSAYYLKRLGRLELSGIPQISFELLTCNDNANRVVPGIFNPDYKMVSLDPLVTKKFFNHNSFSYILNGARATTSHGLQNEPVFSANDFKCCSPLGRTITDGTKCCSGFSVTAGTTKTCALPPGTDLMVYFNRFVSNEGVGADKPGGGLVTSDFDSSTGEPLLSAIVNDKIRTLGAAYCSSKKVRQGGAFGSFEVEPQGSDTNVSSRIYNIVDSSHDVGQNSNAGETITTGYPAFSDGFRWNHHLYCND